MITRQFAGVGTFPFFFLPLLCLPLSLPHTRDNLFVLAYLLYMRRATPRISFLFLDWQEFGAPKFKIGPTLRGESCSAMGIAIDFCLLPLQYLHPACAWVTLVLELSLMNFFYSDNIYPFN